MRFRQSARHLLLAPALIGGVGLAVAGCGGSSGTASGSSAQPSSPGSASPTSDTASSGSTTSATSAPAAPSGAQAQIEANWAAFFLSSTPISRRVALLENGSQFQSVIKAQASSPLASSATAKVTEVTLTSPTQAKVIYTIFVGGAPALTKQSGVAVKQNGIWKVGDQSFCGLLAVENGGKTSKLPPACH
jgi:hypothetical protein